VFDDELNRIAEEVGSRKKAFQLVKADHKLVRFYLLLVPEDPEDSVCSISFQFAESIPATCVDSSKRGTSEVGCPFNRT